MIFRIECQHIVLLQQITQFVLLRLLVEPVAADQGRDFGVEVAAAAEAALLGTGVQEELDGPLVVALPGVQDGEHVVDGGRARHRLQDLQG